MKPLSPYLKHFLIFAGVLGIITIFLPILPLTREVFKFTAFVWATSVAIFSGISLLIFYTSFLILYAFLYRKFSKEINHSAVYFVVSFLVLSIMVVGPMAGFLFDTTFFIIPRTPEQQRSGGGLPAALLAMVIPMAAAFGYSLIASVVGIAVGFRMRRQLGYQTPQPISSDSISSPSALSAHSRVIKFLRDPLTFIILGLFVIPLLMRMFGGEIYNTSNSKGTLNIIRAIGVLAETFLVIVGIIFFFRRQRPSVIEKTEEKSAGQITPIAVPDVNKMAEHQGFIWKITRIIGGFLLSAGIVVPWIVLVILIRIFYRDFDMVVGGFLSVGLAGLLWWWYQKKFPNVAKGFLVGLLLITLLLILASIGSIR